MADDDPKPKPTKGIAFEVIFDPPKNDGAPPAKFTSPTPTRPVSQALIDKKLNDARVRRQSYEALRKENSSRMQRPAENNSRNEQKVEQELNGLTINDGEAPEEAGAVGGAAHVDKDVKKVSSRGDSAAAGGAASGAAEDNGADGKVLNEDKRGNVGGIDMSRPQQVEVNPRQAKKAAASDGAVGGSQAKEDLDYESFARLTRDGTFKGAARRSRGREREAGAKHLPRDKDDDEGRDTWHTKPKSKGPRPN